MSSSIESSPVQRKSVHGRYGFAMIDGDIYLVQLLSCPSPRTYQAHIYRHNFVSIFSYSHTQTLGSNLLEILEADEDTSTPGCLLEEDTETVFVAPDVMSRYVWLKDEFVPRMGRSKPSRRTSIQKPIPLAQRLSQSPRTRIMT